MSLFGDVVSLLNDIADNVLQAEVDVIHKAYIGQDLYGKEQYAAPKTYRAIVSLELKQVYSEGELVWTKASITFLQTLPDTAFTPPFTRVNPIDPNDKFILPDGTTGPILLGSSMLDGETAKPLYQELFLGT